MHDGEAIELLFSVYEISGGNCLHNAGKADWILAETKPRLATLKNFDCGGLLGMAAHALVPGARFVKTSDVLQYLLKVVRHSAMWSGQRRAINHESAVKTHETMPASPSESRVKLRHTPTIGGGLSRTSCEQGQGVRRLVARSGCDDIKKIQGGQDLSSLFVAPEQAPSYRPTLDD